MSKEPHTPPQQASPSAARGKSMDKAEVWTIGVSLLICSIGFGAILAGPPGGSQRSHRPGAGPSWQSDAQSPIYKLQARQDSAPLLSDPQGRALVDLNLRWTSHHGQAQGLAGCAGQESCTVQQALTVSGWEREALPGGGHQWTASARGEVATLKVSWRFEAGDPRARLQGTLTWTADTHPDREALSLTLHERPAVVGRDLRFQTVAEGKTAYSDRWTPHRLIAGTGERALQVMAQGFEAMVAEGTSDGAALTFEVDDARNHPLSAPCPGDEGKSPNRDRQRRRAGDKVSFSVELWLGHTWGPMVGRLPEGRQAAMALIDDSRSLDERRLSAMLWGHSNAEDPRYGNGGFLGFGVPMTVSLPTTTGDALRELADNAHKLGVGLALRAPTAAPSTASTWMGPPPGCAAPPPAAMSVLWSGHNTAPEPRNLNMLSPARAHERATTLWARQSAAGGPRWYFKTVALDGGLIQLRRNLTPQSLERLVKERGVLIARTTLADPGDSPLGDQIDDILKQEEDAHFVVAGNLEKRLVDIKDLSEQETLWLTSVDTLVNWLQASRAVTLHPLSDGRLRLKHPGQNPLKGLTLALPGQGYTVSIGKDSPKGQRVVDMGRGQKETWVWFDLQPGQDALITVADDKGYRLQPLIPVRWSVDDAGR